MVHTFEAFKYEEMTVSNGTLNNEHLFETFIAFFTEIVNGGVGKVLTFKLTDDHKTKVDMFKDVWKESNPEEKNMIVLDLCEILGDLAPNGFYFGEHEGNASDIGYRRTEESRTYIGTVETDELEDYLRRRITTNAVNLPQECVIFDVDGTLAHMTEERHPEPRKRPFQWDKVGTDKVDPNIKWLANLVYSSRFHGMNYKPETERSECSYASPFVIIVTGRDGVCHEETRKWLKDNGIQYDALYQRPKYNNLKDSIIKKDIYEQFIKPNFKVKAVFDDRNQVVDMWREVGLTCCQVAEGDF